MAAETTEKGAGPEKEIYKAAEVCKAADVAPYVLRYWQTEFPVLAQAKDKSPNRLYTRREVRIISRIRQLLYDEGFTIAGAKKKIDAEITGGAFEEAGAKAAPRPARAATADPPEIVRASAIAPAARKAPTVDPKTVVKELREVLKMLEGKPRR